MTWKNPLLRPGALLLAALSLSLGWGIRGNYGHETGAMIPGALAAMAVCLLSGREDWRSRVVFFGLFGMLGWGLGGSISYMQVIGYTHSGHAASQWYGFAGLFVIGFLWAGLGGAATALPAVYSDQKLNALLRPLALVVATCIAWQLLQPWVADRIHSCVLQSSAPESAQRHESLLYWLDSDWLSVGLMLTTLLIYELAQRRFERFGMLLTCAATGGIACYLLFLLLDRTTGNDWILRYLVQPQGLFEERFQASDLAVTNWPAIFLQWGKERGLLYRGEILSLWGGAIAGILFYFVRWGRFSHGIGLLIAMAAGWWLSFLLLPVLGSLFLAESGGLRMTPPRGDNWAGVLGAFLGALWYFWRQKQHELIVVALLVGTVGGIGFSGAAWLELMMVSKGNRNLQAEASEWQPWQETTWQPSSWTSDETMPMPAFATDQPVPDEWQHWHEQNWHSFLEQSYGLINGLGLALGMAFLVTRLPPRKVVPCDRRALLFALLLLLPGLAYVNLVKNVQAWTSSQAGDSAVPETMRAPWVGHAISAEGWFQLFFGVATIAFVGLILRHYRRPIALFSRSWLAQPIALPRVPVGLRGWQLDAYPPGISRTATPYRRSHFLPRDPGESAGADRPARIRGNPVTSHSSLGAQSGSSHSRCHPDVVYGPGRRVLLDAARLRGRPQWTARPALSLRSERRLETRSVTARADAQLTQDTGSGKPGPECISSFTSSLPAEDYFMRKNGRHQPSISERKGSRCSARSARTWSNSPNSK